MSASRAEWFVPEESSHGSSAGGDVRHGDDLSPGMPRLQRRSKNLARSSVGRPPRALADEVLNDILLQHVWKSTPQEWPERRKLDRCKTFFTDSNRMGEVNCEWIFSL
jgi:hypothetical protein